MSKITLSEGIFKSISGKVGDDSLFKQYPYIKTSNGKHYLLWQYENILELQNIREGMEVKLILEVKDEGR